MLKKLNVAVVIMLCFTFVFAIPVQTVQAKTTNKKSVTLTMTEENPTCRCEFAFKKNSKVKMTVKILSTSGKANDEIVYFTGYISDEEECEGPVFPEMQTKKLKKNKTFSSTELSNFRSGQVYFILPKGMEKMKIKVTFSSTEGKKVIKSVKEVEAE